LTASISPYIIYIHIVILWQHGSFVKRKIKTFEEKKMAAKTVPVAPYRRVSHYWKI
jgi:signal transduction histidine kinase